MPQIMFSLIATVVSFFCVLLLRLCWRKLGIRYSFLRCLAWFGIFLNTAFWAKLHGVEFGLAYSAGVLILLVWCVIYVDSCLQSIRFGNKKKAINNNEKKKKEEEKLPENQVTLPSKSENITIWFKTIWLFVLCGPFAFIAMCLLSVFVCFLIPADNSVRLVIAAFLYPLLIGICVYWLCAKETLLRNTIILSIISVISALSLYIFSL